MSKPDAVQPQTSFSAVLRRALEHSNDPAWLSANSPLATPYFLGGRMPGHASTDPQAVGRALQELLYETADSMWDGRPPPTMAALVSDVDEVRMAQGNTGDEYAYLVLELRYFRRYFGPAEYPVESNDIPIYLAVSRTRFFVHLDEAIDRLGELLLRRVRPTMRPERPVPPEIFISRRQEVDEIAAALVAGKSVSLTGSPGVGKSALGTMISQKWPDGHVFWYTFLPGLNDTLGGVLFALAHFTREHGAMALWAYLAAKGGEIDPAQATALLRGDLESLSDPQPLLVIDEIDLLRSTDGDPRSAAHSQLLYFLEALVTTATPLLLIGQRAYVDTSVHLSLESLDTHGVAALLDSVGISLPADPLKRVVEATEGLPRLVWLVIALLRSGEAVDEVAGLSLRGDATPLFYRLWRRLDQDEMELLVALSPFRRPAPQDVWPRHQIAAGSLHERRLLDLRNNGEIAPQPFFRRLVYQELSPEQREHFQLLAGQVRADRGDYTAAAHHFAEANELEAAVVVWFHHRDLEISRGQAGAAKDVFGGMSGKGLPDETLQQLKLIQNQLFLLSGDVERVTSNVRSIQWNPDDVLTAEAYAQAARASYVQGDAAATLDFYGQSLSVMGKHIVDIVNTYYQRGSIYVDQVDLVEAETDAMRAEQRLLLFKGSIARAANRYDRAVEHFLTALRLARELNDPDLVAQTNRRLAEAYGGLGRVDEAEVCLDEAIAYFEQTGDRLNAEWLRVTLGSVYINARMFNEAITQTKRAMIFLEKVGQSQFIAQPLAQLAEAYLETGQPQTAIEYAERVLEVDMPLYRPYAYYTLGLAHQRQGDPVQASEAFDNGLSAAHTNRDRFIEAYLLRNVGRLHIEQGDPAAAREPISAALALFREMGISHEIEATEADLAAITN